jgi:hypothetical protein
LTPTCHRPPGAPATAAAAGLAAKDAAGTAFLDPAVEAVGRALHRAVLAASFAVGAEAQARAGSRAHERLLGLALTPEDLSATLPLAAHTTFQTAAGRHSLAVACQIGDGVVAAVDRRGGVSLLGQPDSGAYSGETDFLTSRRQLEPANLQRKT